MNFLKVKTTWTNTELWLYKFCTACGGVIIGLLFSEFLKVYLFEIILAFSITVIWVVYLWVKKIKRK